MQKHFVRTIFGGCTQNLHLATRLHDFRSKKLINILFDLKLYFFLIKFYICVLFVKY